MCSMYVAPQNLFNNFPLMVYVYMTTFKAVCNILMKCVSMCVEVRETIENILMKP